jgi:glucose-6-phosphate isomerase
MKYSKNFYQIKSNEEIFSKVKDELNTIGYYKLPFQDTSNIKKFASNVSQKYIAVIGIGGSSLGTRAIYEFLKHSNNYSKTLHFFETTDPILLNSTIKDIDLNDTLFIVISKSGTTIETISNFRYLSSLVTIDKSNCVIISENDSKLYSYAVQNNISTFVIPKDVGGRFSVFSAVGLLPLAIVGIDIDNILNGCAKLHNSFFNNGEYYEPIMQKARFLVENKHRFNINVLFSYSSLLESFNKWYIQLWGESLGKININKTKQALTPIGLIGPIDQHSFLQLIIEGKRDKTVTIIKVNNFEDNTKIPDTLNEIDGLEYINNLEFASLLEAQANSTIQAIQEQKDIPCDVITIRTVDEYNIAKLMYTYQLLTSVIGQFLQINTYDQPGVEHGKIILKEKLKFS